MLELGRRIASEYRLNCMRYDTISRDAVRQRAAEAYRWLRSVHDDQSRQRWAYSEDTDGQRQTVDCSCCNKGVKYAVMMTGLAIASTFLVDLGKKTEGSWNKRHYVPVYYRKQSTKTANNMCSNVQQEPKLIEKKLSILDRWSNYIGVVIFLFMYCGLYVLSSMFDSKAEDWNHHAHLTNKLEATVLCCLYTLAPARPLLSKDTWRLLPCWRCIQP